MRLVKSMYLSEADLGGLSGLLSSDYYHDKVRLVQPMRANSRVCSSFDKMEFDEQAKYTMYEVVMNINSVEIPFRFLSRMSFSF